MGEPHLDALSLTTRLLEGIGASERSGDITRALIDVARHPSMAFATLSARLRHARSSVPCPVLGLKETVDLSAFRSPAWSRGVQRRRAMTIWSVICSAFEHCHHIA
jgi:hypothetical protein